MVADGRLMKSRTLCCSKSVPPPDIAGIRRGERTAGKGSPITCPPSLENAILSSLSHPHIIKYIDSFIHEGYKVIVMEYANARSLRTVGFAAMWNV